MSILFMHKQRRFILLLSAIGIISVFLPWVTIGGVFRHQLNANGFSGIGIVVFGALVAVLLITLMGDQKKAEGKTMWMITMVAASIALLFAIIRFGQIAGSGISIVSAGYGLWITLAASLAVIISAWLLKKPADTLDNGFNSLKFKMPHPRHPTHTSTITNNRMEELEKLIELKKQGRMTEAEYNDMKTKLI
ncbi:MULTISPECIES: SHOCT domain-containing protein [Niastella]|uniref:SHOCT domain-containing protein n=1 Tax=Niastella soli TaxID=2821487 RepID=A0ABS3Z0Q1_9BACT|nr:SHOCT domain-containing protein [Niastella soli]MBO9203752.1 hypothetical protein [Niastella soli]